MSPREETRDEQGGLQRLPPGRHGLSREEVARNQRERLAQGVIASVAERGYHDTTITQIAAAAGVSRRTFYGYFDSKEECFFDAFDLIADHVATTLAEAAEGERSWPAKVRAQLEALLDTFAANPDLVRFALIAPPAAGGEFAERYRAFLERLVAILGEGRPKSRARQPSDGAQLAMAGGIAALLVAKVNAGEGERLGELSPELLELVLTPYVGREQAVAEARK